MARFLLFSCSADGSWLAKLLQQNGVEVCLSTETVADLTTTTGLHILKEPDDVEGLATLLQSLQFDCAIDVGSARATGQHKKRRAACAFSDIRYLRLVKMPYTGEECVYVDSGEKAAEILSATTGKALLTIGVRDLDYFTGVPNFQERLYLRIRPSTAVIEQCISMGFLQENLIAMEGPFSRELNGAMLRQVGASLLVTRSAEDGEVTEKLLAARDVGATAVVIGRSKEDNGLTYDELLEVLENDYGVRKEAETGFRPQFPFFVNLQDRKMVVFGGGVAAARRTEVLLGFGQRIAVISPQFDAAFDRLEAVRIQRPYLRGDCEGYQFVFAVTGNREINLTILEEARSAGIPVYVEDAPEESDFAFPEIIQRNQLVMGVCLSTQERKYAQNLMLSLGEQIDSTFSKK